MQLALHIGDYAPATVAILTSTGTLSGTFNPTITYTGAFHLSGATLSYDTLGPNQVDLSYQQTYVTLQVPSNATDNQQQVGNAINNYILAGNTPPVAFQNLSGLSGPSLLNTLTQLDGEAATGAQKASFQLMNDFLDLMLDPTAGGGGNISGGGANGFAPEQDMSLPSDVALAYAKALKQPASQPSRASVAGNTFDQRWGAWGSAFGGASHTDGDAVTGSNDVTASDYGFAAGMDYHVTPDTVYGFGVAGGGTNWNLAQGLGNGRSDAFQAGVYAKTHAGQFYLSGALAFANHWFTTTRTAAFGDQLQANFTGQSYAVRGEAGYRFSVPNIGTQKTGMIVGVTPYAALQVQDFHTPSYSETDLTGGGFGLSYASMNATDTRSELGARFDNLQVVYGVSLVLRGRLAWAHDWMSGASLGAAFQALPGSAFTVSGAAQPRNSALTTAAAELHMTSNWTAIAKFDGEFASGAQTYGGTGTLK
ncbi:MAG: autotransporter outer membrane beta-barrel domain-containing protein [Xanthobacteraceae bacterium]